MNNKLTFVADNIATSGYNLDLRNQAAANYQYDALGNLIKDVYSGITGGDGTNSITWSVYNKPLKIYKAGADSITYLYNTANQRISKNELGITTWYVRDAQGNALGLYDNIHGTTNWREQDLYGSSRLGMWMPNMNMVTNNSVAIWDTVERKQYELDNHLGNVMTTVTDKRLQHSTNGTTIDYFVADVASAQDYYPFGMLMPVRNYTFGSDSTYRYGFNGKENDNTVKGLGNQQDYGERIYDDRVGRFLSVDLLSKQYPELTPYQFAGNTPIQAIDIDGREPYMPWSRIESGEYGETAQKVLTGAAAGMAASLSNTWHFFTRDAWKGSTWKEAGHFFEEMALGASPVTSKIFNTPRLDAAAKSLNDNVVHGDAYTRSKFGGHLVMDIVTAYAGSKGLSTVSAAARVALRVSLAEGFYESFEESNIASKLKGIDFKKPVKTTILKAGTKIQQWVGADGQLGKYFSPIGTDPATTGIDLLKKGGGLQTFSLEKDVKVLQSTAADFEGNKGGVLNILTQN